MTTQTILRAKITLAVLASAAVCQEPAPTTSTSRFEGFCDMVATCSPLLELRLADHVRPARLELRGGAAGAPARIAMSEHLGGTREFGAGAFDADGCFVLPVELERFVGGAFVCQGFEAAIADDGSWMLRASNGLRVAVEQPVCKPVAIEPTSGVEADFSLLRIELGAWRGDEALAEVRALDFVGALGVALNSHGDQLAAKISGKVMVVVPGTPVQVGGAVAYTAKIARDGDEYLVAIGQEVAVLCGVKATSDIGAEGGVSLGGDQIYRFGSPGEVARGLFGIALQQVLPGLVDAARGENLAKVRRLRSNMAALVAALDRLRARRTLRLPAAEAALDSALGAVVLAHARLRRVGDVLERTAGRLVEEARFVRDHTDGAELRVAANGELSLKVGGKKCGDRIGAELGGKLAGGYQVVVRLFQEYGAEPSRVEVTLANVVGGSFAAGIKLGSLVDNNEKALGRGFEVSQKVTRGLLSVYERQGQEFAEPVRSIVIKREFALLGYGRETVVAFDLAELGTSAVAILFAALDGDAGASLQSLAAVKVALAVQDKVTFALKPEFGVENTSLTVKFGAESTWSDCGPLRTAERTLAEVVERLLDVEARAAEVQDLVQQVLELPQRM